MAKDTNREARELLVRRQMHAADALKVAAGSFINASVASSEERAAEIEMVRAFGAFEALGAVRAEMEASES
jgi:hypothetical protein